jgi:hypothetical protein
MLGHHGCAKARGKRLHTTSGSLPPGPAPLQSTSPPGLQLQPIVPAELAFEAPSPVGGTSGAEGEVNKPGAGGLPVGGSGSEGTTSGTEGSGSASGSEGTTSGTEGSGSAPSSEGTSGTEGSGSASGSEGTPPGTEDSGSTGESSSSTEAPTPFRFFAATSFWNEQVAANAPLDPKSAALAGAFANEALTEIKEDEAGFQGAWIGIETTAYGVPIYIVPAGQPMVRVELKGGKAAALQAAWEAVPLPASAHPAEGSDGHLVVWQPSKNRLWEFWRLAHGAEGWSASWGGAMGKVWSNSGVYGTEAWPGALPGWGASASSLSIAGGLITLEDLRMGKINHALAVSIPNVRAGVYTSPAQRTDGRSTDPLSLPEGAHLRLAPWLNLASLHLPPLTLMLAEAAQRYGIFVRDNGPSIAFIAQDPVSTPTNPYLGPNGYFEGTNPMRLLAAFPWSHLQLLHMQLHSSP